MGEPPFDDRRGFAPRARPAAGASRSHVRGRGVPGGRLARLAATALLVAGCVGAPCDGRPERVQLLAVNDVYQLEPDADDRGGLARVATLVRDLRGRTPATVFALAGDTLSPSLLSTLFRGEQIIEAWNALGLDVAALGNHEFDFGPAVLRARMRESRFAWLGSNVREAAGGRPFGGARPSLVRQWGRVRLGLVGLTLPESAQTSSPGPEVAFLPPVEAARAALADLGPLDLRVAVTHLELRQDRALAAAVPLDAILGGHDHEPMVRLEGPTLIVKAGADAINVAQVEYALACDGRVVDRRLRLLPVDGAIAPAPDVAALVERWSTRAARELDQPVGRTDRPMDAREAALRRQQTDLGHFLAEAMRARVGAEVALLNSGAIRSNRVIPAGPITRRDFVALLPFSNVIVLLEVPGTALREALERSLASLPAAAGSFLQVAGLRVEADPGRPPGDRVTRVEVAGRPLDPGRRYRVAVPDYLARGGNGYVMLAAGSVLIGPGDGPGLVETVLEAVARGASP